MFFSFALFFGMILADAGYSLLLGGLLSFSWKRLGGSETGQGLRVLFVWLLGSTLAYGILVGSYFGLSPPVASFLGKLAILDLDDYDTMMRLSVVIGGLHIAMANALMAYHRQGWAARGQPMGWCAAVLGGLFTWFGSGGSGVAAGLGLAGPLLIAVGLIAVFWFADTTPVLTLRDLPRRLAKGLLTLSSVTRIFGDVLSYMRLFALGLASASLAITFNQLATQVVNALPGIGILIAILILVLGHTINIGLSIMSGVVHGLRLNVLELLNWTISEEGYPFKSFAKREVSQ